MILVRGLIALLFALGAVLMVGGAVVAWVYVVAMTASQVHAVVGLVVFAGSLLVGHRNRDALAAPWQMWMGLWGMVDDWLVNLKGRNDEAIQPCSPAGPKRLRLQR